MSDRPKVLLGYQSRWFADDSPVKMIEKSRRIGITWTSGIRAVMDCARDTQDTFYVGYREDLAEEFIRGCAEFAKGLNLAVTDVGVELFPDVDPDTGEVKRSIKSFRIDFGNRRRIMGLSSAPRNLRGMQGRVLIDEAAFHPNLRELIKAAIALLMWGGCVEIVSTHDGVDNEFNQLIEEVRAGKFPYALHRVTLDDALRDGLYERICLVTGQTWSREAETAWRRGLIDFYGEGADEELFCTPSKGGVTYFQRDVVERSMVVGRPVVRLQLASEFVARPEAERVAHVAKWLALEVAPLVAKLPRDRQHFLGVDFGRVADLSVFAPGTLLPNLVRSVPFLIELSNVPFEQQKQIAFAVCDGLPRFTRARFDATGNGAYLAEVCAQKYGESRIEQVKISEAWHLETWPVLRAGLEDGKIALPSDEQVRNDFTAVKRVNGIPKLPSASTIKVQGEGRTIRRHGDAAVAVAMLLTATRDVEQALERGGKWKQAAAGLAGR